MTRLENTILYLLGRAKQKGKDNLSKIELFKLLYLLEIESRKFTGKSFLENINFVRYKNGPISLEVYNALNNLKNNYIRITDKKNSDYPHSRHCIFLKKKVGKLKFSDSERMFMNSVFETYLPLNIKKLKEEAYNTLPMKRIVEEEQKKKESLKGYPIDFNCVPLDEDMVDLIAA